MQRMIEEPRSRYLVFSSVGDRANVTAWLGASRDFDLWICYYGEEPGRYAEVGEYYLQRQGGKFPNLHYVYTHWRETLARYDAILVMDDDILLDAAAISRLFALRQGYDLWLLQPAFSPLGKVSHRITRRRPFCLLRYTNFVEMTCPLFRQDKLAAFMALYDPALVGWGTDHWYMASLGPEVAGRVAIVDAVPCVNPHDDTKGGEREIDRLQGQAARQATWQRIQAAHGIAEQAPREFGTVAGPRDPLSLWRATGAWLLGRLVQLRGRARYLRDRLSGRRRQA